MRPNLDEPYNITVTEKKKPDTKELLLYDTTQKC